MLAGTEQSERSEEVGNLQMIYLNGSLLAHKELKVADLFIPAGFDFLGMSLLKAHWQERAARFQG